MVYHKQRMIEYYRSITSNSLETDNKGQYVSPILFLFLSFPFAFVHVCLSHETPLLYLLSLSLYPPPFLGLCHFVVILFTSMHPISLINTSFRFYTLYFTMLHFNSLHLLQFTQSFYFLPVVRYSGMKLINCPTAMRETFPANISQNRGSRLILESTSEMLSTTS